MMSIRYATSMLHSGSNVLGNLHGLKVLSSITGSTHLLPPIKMATTSMGSIRHHTAPAYRRFLKKKGINDGIYFKGKGSGPGPVTAIRVGSSPRIPAEKPGIQVPSLAVAEALPNGWSEMDNEPLLAVAEMGNHGARIELLKRHIMAVDKVGYEIAEMTFEKIAAKSSEGVFLQMIPYQIGIAFSLMAAMAAWPMVFDEATSLWFNHHFVTMEIPEPSDLDTWLEVGAWTWNWNEPFIGTASFSLLCLQFSRAQIKNLGMKPFTAMLKERRAKALSAAFPQYSEHYLHEFVETQPLYKSVFNN
ncbi:hypothetical protein IV203_022133 [Nitzschia inconspicua]|uniref:Uncharacterized protein n=1 Tax=Nitzschia inconspicua TaxID=303405 RepID=A0A9K3PEG6_9STRA|nr:hypothetical protein IV203_022133 [Nitzschia inconspicua]